MGIIYSLNGHYVPLGTAFAVKARRIEYDVPPVVTAFYYAPIISKSSYSSFVTSPLPARSIGSPR